MNNNTEIINTLRELKQQVKSLTDELKMVKNNNTANNYLNKHVVKLYVFVNNNPYDIRKTTSLYGHEPLLHEMITNDKCNDMIKPSLEQDYFGACLRTNDITVIPTMLLRNGFKYSHESTDYDCQNLNNVENYEVWIRG